MKVACAKHFPGIRINRWGKLKAACIERMFTYMVYTYLHLYRKRHDKYADLNYKLLQIVGKILLSPLPWGHWQPNWLWSGWCGGGKGVSPWICWRWPGRCRKWLSPARWPEGDKKATGDGAVRQPCSWSRSAFPLEEEIVVESGWGCGLKPLRFEGETVGSAVFQLHSCRVSDRLRRPTNCGRLWRGCADDWDSGKRPTRPHWYGPIGAGRSVGKIFLITTTIKCAKCR